MLFPDYTQTGVVYHIINVNDYHKIKEEGIKYDSKFTYKCKYLDFHNFMNSHKPDRVPGWVDRSKAIFASMNFKEDHHWHSHSILLAVKIDPSRCWVANENKANQVYEPFVLHRIDEFTGAARFLEGKGREIVKEYWETSLSFEENLKYRRDREPGYDAEVMVFHSIKPEDIQCLAIISDHSIMTVAQWKEIFCK